MRKNWRRPNVPPGRRAPIGASQGSQNHRRQTPRSSPIAPSARRVITAVARKGPRGSRWVRGSAEGHVATRGCKGTKRATLATAVFRRSPQSRRDGFPQEAACPGWRHLAQPRARWIIVDLAPRPRRWYSPRLQTRQNSGREATQIQGATQQNSGREATSNVPRNRRWETSPIAST